MKRLLSVAAVFCLSSLAFAQAPADISGTWTTQTEVQGIAVNETCHLTETADGVLGGICETSGGKFKLTGKVAGNQCQLFTSSQLPAGRHDRLILR